MSTSGYAPKQSPVDEYLQEQKDEQIGAISFQQAAKMQLLKMAHAPRAPKTGIPELDRYIVGFLPGSITVLGAETSSGKTTFAANLAANIAQQQGKRVLFFSLESGASVAQMITCCIRQKKRTDLTAQELTSPIENIQIVAPPRQLSLGEVERIIYENPSALVILDHIHYLLNSAENVTASIGNIVRDLQMMARKHNTHIFVISHLKKPDRGRENEIPQITRLKDSSSLYQDPSIVMMLWRPRKSIELLEPGEDVFQSEGMVIVAKNRDFGPTGIARFIFERDKHHFNFGGITEVKEEQPAEQQSVVPLDDIPF